MGASLKRPGPTTWLLICLHCPPFARQFCGFSQWKELGDFSSGGLTQKTPGDAKGRPRVPLGFGLFWVFFKVLTAKSFHLLGKQHMVSHKTANPCLWEFKCSQHCSLQAKAFPLFPELLLLQESRKRGEAAPKIPLLNSEINIGTTPDKDLLLWEGRSREVAYSMRNNIQNLNPAQLLPPNTTLCPPGLTCTHQVFIIKILPRRNTTN